MDVGGQDATDSFEDVGHSDEAREILDKMLIGHVKRSVSLPSLLLLYWDLKKNLGLIATIFTAARRPKAENSRTTGCTSPRPGLRWWSVSPWHMRSYRCKI